MVTVLTFRQLLVAWFAGARFDIAYYEAKKSISALLGSGSQQITEVKVDVDHSEL